MPELTAPGPVAENAGIREAVCIHTKKIYDSCRDKDPTPYKHTRSPHLRMGASFVSESDTYFLGLL